MPVSNSVTVHVRACSDELGLRVASAAGGENGQVLRSS